VLFFKQSNNYSRFPVCHFFDRRDIRASYNKWVDWSILTFARWGLKVNLDSCSFRGVCAIAVSGVSGTVISWNDKKKMIRKNNNELIMNQNINLRMYTEIFKMLRFTVFDIIWLFLSFEHILSWFLCFFFSKFLRLYLSSQ